MSQLPFPSANNNDAQAPRSSRTGKPWELARTGDPPPSYLEIRFADGRSVQYAYCDIREICLRDAGCLSLRVLGFEKQVIRLEGRHLQELSRLIGEWRVKWLIEAGRRSYEIPEAEPCIDQVTIETLGTPLAI